MNHTDQLRVRAEAGTARGAAAVWADARSAADRPRHRGPVLAVLVALLAAAVGGAWLVGTRGDDRPVSTDDPPLASDPPPSPTAAPQPPSTPTTPSSAPQPCTVVVLNGSGSSGAATQASARLAVAEAASTADGAVAAMVVSQPLNAAEVVERSVVLAPAAAACADALALVESTLAIDSTLRPPWPSGLADANRPFTVDDRTIVVVLGTDLPRPTPDAANPESCAVIVLNGTGTSGVSEDLAARIGDRLFQLGDHSTSVAASATDLDRSIEQTTILAPAEGSCTNHETLVAAVTGVDAVVRPPWPPTLADLARADQRTILVVLGTDRPWPTDPSVPAVVFPPRVVPLGWEVASLDELIIEPCDAPSVGIRSGTLDGAPVSADPAVAMVAFLEWWQPGAEYPFDPPWRTWFGAARRCRRTGVRLRRRHPRGRSDPGGREPGRPADRDPRRLAGHLVALVGLLSPTPRGGSTAMRRRPPGRGAAARTSASVSGSGALINQRPSLGPSTWTPSRSGSPATNASAAAPETSAIAAYGGSRSSARRARSPSTSRPGSACSTASSTG